MPRQSWTERREYEHLQSGLEGSASARNRGRARNQFFRAARRVGLPGRPTPKKDQLEESAGRD
jgi:hypothetical protein